MSWTHGLRRVSQLACEALRTGGSAEESVGESCTSSERACGACAGARPAQPGREPEKQGCMCDESMRRRWLSSSQGFVPILATCMSFKKWVRAVHFEFHCGERTRREAVSQSQLAPRGRKRSDF